MPNNLKSQQQINLKMMNIKNKSVAIIGSGFMANHYSLALSKIGIHDVEIIGRTKKSVRSISEKYDFKSIHQDYNNGIKLLSEKDLVIVATPIQDIISATKLAIKYGQKNILIEKPGSLYSNELLKLNKIKKSQKILLGTIDYSIQIFTSYFNL